MIALGLYMKIIMRMALIEGFQMGLLAMVIQTVTC